MMARRGMVERRRKETSGTYGEQRASESQIVADSRPDEARESHRFNVCDND